MLTLLAGHRECVRVDGLPLEAGAQNAENSPTDHARRPRREPQDDASEPD